MNQTQKPEQVCSRASAQHQSFQVIHLSKMFKVHEGLKWENGFTYKFEFHSVSMKLIFGHGTNVLLMLNNNFTHQIFLLTSVCVWLWAAPPAGWRQEVVHGLTSDHTGSFYSCCWCLVDFISALLLQDDDTFPWFIFCFQWDFWFLFYFYLKPGSFFIRTCSWTCFFFFFFFI